MDAVPDGMMEFFVWQMMDSSICRWWSCTVHWIAKAAGSHAASRCLYLIFACCLQVPPPKTFYHLLYQTFYLPFESTKFADYTFNDYICGRQWYWLTFLNEAEFTSCVHKLSGQPTGAWGWDWGSPRWKGFHENLLDDWLTDWQGTLCF